MGWFRDDGHLTEAALRALVKGELDDLSRLEVSEHLDFCDECLLKYLEMLEGDSLLGPQEPAAPRVMQRIKRSGRAVSIKRYATVAAAVALVLTMWGSGFFTMIGQQTGAPEDPAAQKSSQAAEKKESPPSVGEAMSGLADAVNGFFGGVGEMMPSTMGGTPASPQEKVKEGEKKAREEEQKKLEQEEAQRKEKEAVFKKGTE